MKTIAVLNQKGGVGKSTLSINLAESLTRRKFRVMVLDTDPQETATNWSFTRDAKTGQNQEPRVYSQAADVISIENFEGFDFRIIDGRPNTGKITASTVKSADMVLVPISASLLDVDGSYNLVQIIDTFHELNPNKPQAFFVLNGIIPGTNIIDETIQAVSKFSIPFLSQNASPIIIGHRVKFKETFGHGETIFDSKDTKGISEIESLTYAVLEALSC